jgi:uncharacterized protein (TIRG00374 family)
MNTIRRILYWVLAVAFAWYVLTNFHEIVAIFQQMRSGTWYWIVAALVLQLGHYGFHALTLRETFAVFGVKRPLREILPVSLSMLAVNVIAPSLNLSGQAVVVEESRRRGHPPAASAAAALLGVAMDGIVFLLYACALLILFTIRHSLDPIMLSGTLVFAALVGGILGGGAYLWRNPSHARTLLVRFERITGGKSLRVAKAWEDLTTSTKPQLRYLWSAFGWEVLGHLSNIASLSACFAAFGVDPLSLVPLTAYVVAIVTVFVSPVPLGIGFVEAGMTAALAAKGIPVPTATAITLVFRGVNFWLPFFIGMAYLQKIRQMSGHNHGDDVPVVA